MNAFKTIAFVLPSLDNRGTSVAAFHYADALERVLSHRSVIILSANATPHPEAFRMFRGRFPVIACEGPGKLDATLERARADLAYFIKRGVPDEWISRSVPAAVHAVFPTWQRDAHGTHYAYVSRWLSRVCTNLAAPWVPHIVQVASTPANMREALAVPRNALVVGCYGGPDSFDVKIARQALAKALDQRSDLWFIAMNLNSFITHERAIFLPGTVDNVKKREFINTCDVMLHARQRGETFGLAVAEFSASNKPVMTWGGSTERAHLDALGDAALVYKSEHGLLRMLLELTRDWIQRRHDWDCYSRTYGSEPVIGKFADVFLGKPTNLEAIRTAWVGPEDARPSSLLRYARRWRRMMRGKGP